MPAQAWCTVAYANGYTASYLSERHNRSTNTLSIHRPLPSMLTLTSCASSTATHSMAVYCAP